MSTAKKLVLFLSSFFFFGHAFSNELNALKQHTLDNNPHIIRAREDILFSQAGEIKQPYIPKTTTSWDDAYLDRDAELEVFEGGRRFIKRKSQKAMIDVCESRLQTITIQVLQELESVYLSICLLKEERRYMLESIEVFESLKPQLSEEKLDLLNSEIQKHHIAVRGIESDIDMLKDRLHQVLSLPKSNEPIVANLSFDFESDDSAATAEVDPYGCLQKAFKSRPELKEVDAQNRLSELKSIGNLLAFIPAVGLNAQYRGNSTSGNSSASASGYYSLGFVSGSNSSITSFERSYSNNYGNRGSSGSLKNGWTVGVSLNWSFSMKGEKKDPQKVDPSPEELKERMNLVKDLIRQQISFVSLRVRNASRELGVLNTKFDAISTDQNADSIDPERVISKRNLGINILQKEKELTLAKVVLKYTTGG
ncbi:MAG: hypothetical protein MI922_06610 [Bacteroidales bacterium]|nr:hypothetical protein [Bacteroidales bacterium]